MNRSDTPRTLPSALAADGSLSVTYLQNGLKVICKQDARTPVAICHVWVRVGSNREPDGLRGWAHGIEHMVFKGTARRQESDFAREVADAGGSTNAGTGYETTSYHIVVPKERLPVAVDILGDALFNASFEPAALEAERQVLVHENHMYDDIPSGFGVTWRWGLELAFDHSPYQHPIGGRDEQLLSVPREDILDFYHATYRPDNMTVVVVGDLDPDATVQLIGQRFGADDRPAGQLPEPPCEPPQRAPRLRLETGDIQRAYVKLAFHAPAETASERPAMSVANHVLADGRSCRLYRVVQEQKRLVSDISTMSESGPREGVFLIDFETDIDRVAAALTATAEVLEQLRSERCDEQELARAKIRVERSYRLSAETVQGQSSTIGYHDAMGDLEGAFLFPDRVRAVTDKDVQLLCRDMFRSSNCSCVIYLPTGTDAEAAGIPRSAEQLADLLAPVLGDIDTADAAAPAAGGDNDGDAAAPTPDAQAATPDRTRTAGMRTAPPVAGDFEQTQLGSGVSVLLRTDPSLPVVSLVLQAAGGARRETPANAGLASLCQQVRVKGTGELDAENIHEIIESRGGTLAPRSDRDFTALTLTGLSIHLEALLELTGQLVCRPSFPLPEIEQERQLAIEQLRALSDDPFQFAALKLRGLLYGDEHPYGRPLAGSEASLARLDRDALLDYHAQVWTTGNLQIVASGDFVADTLLAQLENALSGLPPAGAPDWPDLFVHRPPAGAVRETVERDQNQAIVMVGWPGPANPDQDRVPLLMLKELLNGQSGRLFEALRNRRSLCYNTGLLSTSGFAPGMIVGYVLTDPVSGEDALAALCDELATMSVADATDEEFARARAKLTGNLLIGNQANGARVGRCARDIMYGRSANDLPRLLEAIAACDVRQVREAAGRYFDVENRYEVVIGPRPAAHG